MDQNETECNQSTEINDAEVRKYVTFFRTYLITFQWRTDKM